MGNISYSCLATCSVETQRSNRTLIILPENYFFKVNMHYNKDILQRERYSNIFMLNKKDKQITKARTMIGMQFEKGPCNKVLGWLTENLQPINALDFVNQHAIQKSRVAMDPY